MKLGFIQYWHLYEGKNDDAEVISSVVLSDTEFSCTYPECSFVKDVSSGPTTTFDRWAFVYLALALPLQVHNAHVHNGPQVGEGLHHPHVGTLVIAVDVQLDKRIKETVSRSLWRAQG